MRNAVRLEDREAPLPATLEEFGAEATLANARLPDDPYHLRVPLKPLVPAPFGPLEGIRILSTGSLIAQPFGAALAAEMGAEVIQVERPGEGDIGWRHLGVELPRKDGPGRIGTS